MKTFKEWFKSQDMPIPIELFRISGGGFILKSEMTPILKEGAQFAWDYLIIKIASQTKELVERGEKLSKLFDENAELRVRIRTLELRNKRQFDKLRELE